MNTTVATIFSNPWFQNILSEFLVLAILLGLGWVLYRLMSRGPLLSFFRIRQSKRPFVYLSNLFVQRGGAVGIDGIPRGFEGSAIPTYEALLMPAVQRLFNYVVPGVDSLPGFLKQLLLSDVTVEVLPSPLDVSAIEGEA